MAKFNEILVGRFNRGLQKITGIKGAAVVPQLGSEILPTFPLFWGVECRYLEGWNRFAAAINVANIAANTNAVRFRNPPTSNLLAVFEKIQMVNSNASVQQIDLEFAPGGGTQAAVNADLNTVSGGVMRLDARSGGIPIQGTGSQNVSTALVISTQNNPSPASLFVFSQTLLAVNSNPSDFILTDDQEITLLPGDTFDMRSVTVNAGLTINVIWRERFLEDTERL